jgi:hypothetical protein
VEKRKKSKMPFFKFCETCENRFQPVGKYEKNCEGCRYKLIRGNSKKRKMVKK